jgi:imidazoleglycerol-phosphate dehydratase
MARTAQVSRSTKETSIEVSIDLDGTGVASISTGIPFYDHMLEQLARHGGFDLTIAAKGGRRCEGHHQHTDPHTSLRRREAGAFFVIQSCRHNRF